MPTESEEGGNGPDSRERHAHPPRDPLEKHIRRGLWLVVLTGTGALGIAVAYFFKIRSEVPPSNVTAALPVATSLGVSLSASAYSMAAVSVLASLTMILLTAQSMRSELMLHRIRQRTFQLQLFLALFPLGLAAFGILMATLAQTALATPNLPSPSEALSGLSQLDIVLLFVIIWQGLYLIVLIEVAIIALLSRNEALSRAGSRMLDEIGEGRHKKDQIQ